MDSTVSTGAAAMMAVRVLLVRGRAGWGAYSPREGGTGRALMVPCCRTTTCRRSASSCCLC